MPENLKNKCAIFVSSCDAFSDAWEPFFKLFFRYWPDCPFPIFLIANQLEYNDKRVKAIKLYPDKGWAINMRESLEKFNYPYIIYFQEDYFLKTAVDNKRILNLLDILIKERAGCLRLWPSPGPDKNFKNYRDIGQINEDSSYRVSLQAAIWDKEIFKDLLVSGETGRDMEFSGSERSKKIKSPFLSVTKSRYLKLNNNPAIDYFCTGIVKGKWNYGVINFFRKQGIEIKGSKRGVESKKRYRARFLRGLPVFGIFLGFYYRALEKIKLALKNNAYKIKSKVLIIALFFKKYYQKKNFNALKREFADNLKSAAANGFKQHIIPEWQENLKAVENDFKKNLRFDFLRHPVIQKTMFIGNKPWVAGELDYIENKFSAKRIKDLLEEDYIGKPFINNWKYLTSNNSIHHLYHLARYLDKTNSDLNKINSVIEWGGGYGNFAKIFWRLKKADCAYVIIDLPVFSCLQFIYLGSIFGKDKVNFINSRDKKIAEGKINILPISFLKKFKLKGDLFVSTWAISESSAFFQDYAVEQGWFDSPHLLLAFQSSSEKFPFAERIKELVKGNNIISEDISFLPGNKYIFR
ncbi:MAG: hypothetical protein UT31_C0024G0002 [Parcubacteria group bacterium GW2011_GWF2_39_13b]|nr:MAG: hypothetical protein UT31_C0024G0002 [Parcubacteria group bacterium GW2011_GWF2_39_13b]